MVFSFFEDLYEIPEVKEAFLVTIANRLQDYGYFDMNQFIKTTKTKKEFREELRKVHSKYEILYKEAYPSKEDAYEFWRNNIAENKDSCDEELSPLEAEAIISWAYQTIKTQKDRAMLTKELFSTS